AWTAQVFRRFPDRGWGLSKLLGMLALAYLVWLPASLRLLPFDHWVVVGAFLLLGMVGAALAWRRRVELRAFIRERWRLLAICEAAFLGAFLVMTWVRARNPDLWHIYHGGEKPMELAFLNGMLRSRALPPLDAWFSGGYINYYYYGQYLFAVLIKLTGIAPTTAFNLAIPLVFAIAFTAAFSLVAGLTRRWWAGLVGGAALVVVANLDGLAQVIGQWQAVWAGQVPAAFDYWRSSRVIPFTINEFPSWSFLYADLHAHLIDLPVVVLIIAACASLLATARADGGRWRPAVPTLAVLALAVGAVWGISTWDVPLSLVLVGMALTLRPLLGEPPAAWRGLGAWLSWPRVRAYGSALALTLVGAYLLYFPFHASYAQVGVSGLGPVTTPTDPGQFVTLFGLWLFLTASFFFVELRDHWERAITTRDPAAAAEANARLWLLAGGYAVALLLAYRISVKSLLLALLLLGLFLAWDARRSPAKLVTYLLLLLGLAVAYGVEVVYIRDFLDQSPYERMNTVFKFYYEVWICLALGSALAFTYLIARIFGDGAPPAERDTPLVDPPAPPLDGGPSAEPWPRASSARGALLALWLGVLLVLVIGSSLFLVYGTQARVAEHVTWAAIQPPPGGIQPRGLSLDGMAYMRGWYPSDYAAITWMNDHIAGDPTIVEATNGPYQWYGRVAEYTGLPSVLGWSDHEAEQRYGPQVYARQTDVQAFYAGTDPSAALAFLNFYGVRYVYVGELERTCFMTTGQENRCVPMTPAALTKYDTLERSGALRTVYRAPGTVIYQVVR
ncbi:MAG: hypothetical protein IVW57_10965, partial [Ktedonobacterales bacterium]|nr:hypothetical protein [Ktedonobacterales bacterium]